MGENQTKNHKDLILETLNSVKRDGMTQLIEYLKSTDFFSAPASTRFHSSKEGGLAEHSWNVYRLFKHKNEIFKLGLSDDTVAICALLHDICKVGMYVQVTKNVKKGTKSNGYGKEVANWVEELCYEYNDNFPVGHGEKSVCMLQRYIELSDFEILAIRWHMGFTEPKDIMYQYNAALDNSPSIICLFTADVEASQILEKKPEGK